MQRRDILKTRAAGLAAGAGRVAAKAQTVAQTFVLVHGAWLSKDITLDTFTEDIANVIKTEELSSLILVGHSFGGLANSGVAERVPDKLRHLVYLEGRKSPPATTPW
jgi:pimeloyl-ACP methyl ester carboxylesterase